jgi:hypothetical protein
MRKHSRDLERADEPQPRHIGRRKAADVLAFKDDAAARRLQEFRKQVEAGGLAGAIGPDQRMNAAAADAQGDAVDGNKARKFLGQVLCREDRIVIIHHSPRRPSSRVLYDAQGGLKA